MECNIQAEMTVSGVPTPGSSGAQGEPGKAVREAWGQIQLTAKAVGWASVQLSVPKLTMCL